MMYFLKLEKGNTEKISPGKYKKYFYFTIHLARRIIQTPTFLEQFCYIPMLRFEKRSTKTSREVSAKPKAQR